MPDPAPAPASPSAGKAQVFAKRLASTVALWALVAAAIVLGKSWLFFVLLGFIGMAAVVEYVRIDAGLPRPWRAGFIVFAAAYMGWTFSWCQRHGGGAIPNGSILEWPAFVDMMFLALAPMAAVIPALFRPLEGRATLWAIVYTVAGFIYVPWLWSFMTRILFARGMDAENHVAGLPWLFFVVAATKFTDSGAYAVGSLIGKHKMIPHVSPGKTWEGMIGAILGALAGGMAVYWGYGEERMHFSRGHAIVLCLVLAVACVLGDLAESVLKRCLAVKDSGRMLPGIGGALDLIDSLLWTGPVFYFYIKYVSAA
jgi:phosphatidate cytidylyltransferase